MPFDNIITDRLIKAAAASVAAPQPASSPQPPRTPVHVPLPKRASMTSEQQAQLARAAAATLQRTAAHAAQSSAALAIARSPFASSTAAPVASPGLGVGSPGLNGSASPFTIGATSNVLPSRSPGPARSPLSAAGEEVTDDAHQAEMEDEFEELPPPVLGLARSNSTHHPAGGRSKRDHAAVPLLSTQILPANVYVQQRVGSILSRSMILKADQFPYEGFREVDLHVIGAPNFQQIRPAAIYSTGQPSVSGIRTVLNLLHLKQNPRRRVQWINLREEPVVYLNNRPFVLRELEQAFRNMDDFAGIDTQRLQRIETSLKADILGEADNNYGNILVHDEEEIGALRACWTSVHESNVKTSEEVYAQLTKEGYNVSYLRVPVTAEAVIEARQMDAIIRCFVDSRRMAAHASHGSMSVYQPAGPGGGSYATDGLETFYVINDQMGRGRSTIGMIVILLLMQHASPRSSVDEARAREALAKPLAADHGHGHEHEHDGLSAYRRGDFEIILKLQRMLKDGSRCKREVDIAIDLCGRVHHLRDQIVASFVQSEHARADDQHRVFSSATASYLRRYYYLICFQSFLHDRASQPLDRVLEAGHTFSDWWAAHPELQKLMATLVEDEALVEIIHPDQQLATTTHTSGDSTRASSDDQQLVVSPPGTSSEANDFCSFLDRFVFTRALPVLSRRTIVKSEFFHFATRHQRVLFEHGLPNFRYYENLPLAATAQPNVRGIRNILHFLQDTARRRDRRIEAEAEAEAAAEVAAGTEVDPRLREVVQRHAHADSPHASVGSVRHLGHHSASALHLTRGTSDASDDIEPLRYKAGVHSPPAPALNRSASLPSHQVSESQILWINLREEPVVFINSEPYLVRDYRHPFRVLTEFSVGMSQERTELVEDGFKADVMHELAESVSGRAAADDPRLVVHEETVSGQIRPRYESVRQPLAEHVQTTAEVYASLRRQGYNLAYYRVPLHVEEVPGLKSFDRLFELLNSSDLVEEKINVVFSCQKGGRRSTMGMAVCVLMLMHQRSVHYSILRGTDAAASQSAPLTAAEKLASLNLNLAHHQPGQSASELRNVTGAGQDDANVHGHTVSISAHPTPIKRPPPRSNNGGSATGNVSVGSPPIGSPAPVPTPGLKKSQSSVSIHIEEIDRRETRARYGRGEYKGILQLIRILKEGGRVKEEVDVAIDTVGGIVNIRDSIARAKSRADGERQKEKGLQSKALKYLESYAYLICFNSYLRERRDTEEETRAAEAEADQKLEEAMRTDDEQKHVQFPDAAEADDGSATPPTLSPASSLARGGTLSFPSFSMWIASRPELRKQLEDIHRDPEDALKLNLLSVTDDAYAPIYESRQGNVLVNGSILKGKHKACVPASSDGTKPRSDFFMGCMTGKIEQIIDGAINFRPIELFPCAGTGIPTAKGIRGILEFYTTPPADLSAQGLGRFAPLYQASTLIWMNLREEPLLYVQGKPFVLRDGDNPYVNVEHTGINTRRLEAMERQLRRDLLAESERMRSSHVYAAAAATHSPASPDPQVLSPASASGDEDAAPLTTSTKAVGGFLVHDEDDNGNLIAVWQDGISKATIQTPQMLFLRCFEEVVRAKQAQGGAVAGFTASYYRTPITDEQAPSPSTLDDIIAALETARDAPNPVFLMNCQMGRGRTTTGLIIASLWCIHRGKIEGYDAWLNQDTKKKSTAHNQLAAVASPSKSLFNTGSTSATYMEPSSITGDDEQSASKREEEFANGLRHGWYKCIQSLVRLIRDGAQIKRQVDRVIDHCGTFQNLRECVYATQELALTCLPRKKSFFVHRGNCYLSRYFFLILINAYMTSEVPHDFKRLTFTDWLASRPELQNILATSTYPEEYKPAAADVAKSSRRTASLLSPLQVPTGLLDRAAAAGAAAPSALSTPTK